jgi:hypothetical protein
VLLEKLRAKLGSERRLDEALKARCYLPSFDRFEEKYFYIS